MRRRLQQHLHIAVSVLILCLSLTSVAAAQTFVTGTTGGGAYYQIAVPDLWNGDLVIWNHGFDLEPPSPEPDLGPLVDLQLLEGYAVAASSYQQSGWALFKTKNDLLHLVNTFEDLFGAPGQVLLTGASLGGLVTAQAIERADLGNVTGALAICGAMAGSRNWDAALDLRLVYDVACEDVPTAAIPGGAEGLPEDSTLTDTDVIVAVNECTGVLVPPELRTPDQTANLAQILDIAQIPEEFLLTDMVYSTFGMSDLVHSQGKLRGKIGAGNSGVFYGDPEIDSGIERVEPNRGAANRLESRYTPNGQVGNTRIVSLHTDKDGLVIVENQSEYAAVVPSTHLTTAVIVEDEPTHCGFTGAETVAGWELMRAWAAGGPQPTAELLQATCLTLEADFGGPCRIDPDFVIPDMDERIRPR